VELASESFHRGLGLRAVVAGAVGFSSTSDMSLLPFVAEDIRCIKMQEQSAVRGILRFASCSLHLFPKVTER